MIGFALFSRRIDPVSILAVLLLSAFVLTATAWQRGAEYDEGYTIFLADGVPRPDWPAGAFRAGDVRGFFDGTSTAPRIAADLRADDVHPPLYFWTAAAWRAAAGPGLFKLRLLSVGLGLLALLAVAAIARLAAVPPIAAVLLTLGCYGFSYTAAVARGFALAQALTLAGVLLLLLAERRGRVAAAAAAAASGGVLLGLATFSTYLAVFVAAAALAWLFLVRLRRPSLWLAAGAGFAVVLPADLFFFLAQRDSRVGQFPPFHLLPSLERLGQYAAGNVLAACPSTSPARRGWGWRRRSHCCWSRWSC